MGDSLFVFGGNVEDHKPTATCLRYDRSKDLWTTIPPLSCARRYLASVRVNNYIYVTGGNAGSILSNVDRYDVNTNTWTKMSPMTNPKCDHYLIHKNGLIYAIGKIVVKVSHK
jgi:N-acetylneuraminic acid mutarotase